MTEYTIYTSSFVRLSTYVSPKGETCTAVRCIHENANVSSHGRVHRVLKHDVRFVDFSLHAARVFLHFPLAAFLSDSLPCFLSFFFLFFFCLRRTVPCTMHCNAHSPRDSILNANWMSSDVYPFAKFAQIYVTSGRIHSFCQFSNTPYFFSYVSALHMQIDIPPKLCKVLRARD